MDQERDQEQVVTPIDLGVVTMRIVPEQGITQDGD